MKVKARNKVTGETQEMEMSKEQAQRLASSLQTKASPSRLKHKLDNLDIAAEVKATLWAMQDWVVVIGRRVFHVGRKLLGVLIHMVTRYPTMTAGMLLGMLCWYVLSHVPFVGDFLGAAIFAILGLLGFAADWKVLARQHPDIARELAEIFGQARGATAS